MDIGFVVFLLFLVAFLLTLAFCVDAESSPPKFIESNIVRAIVGESSGEGHAGMYYLACAIVNKGTLKKWLIFPIMKRFVL